MYAPGLDLGHQGHEAPTLCPRYRLLFFQSLFVGEVDDVAGAGQLCVLHDKHAPRGKLSPLAGLLIELEVIREGLLELEGDTPTPLRRRS